jgi:hypothetical protein
MKKEDLLIQLKEIETKADLEKLELIKKFCLLNNPYKIGDKITDLSGSIIIEKIKFSRYDMCCVYFGSSLKKDGTPRKDGEKRNIIQNQIQ